MKKAIIFDMDGLMIDSERVTFEGYQKVLGTMNLSITEDFYKCLLGKTLKDATPLFKEKYGQDFPLDHVIKAVHAYMHDTFQQDGIPIKPGLLSLLDYLKTHDYLTIVATSSARARVDTILELAQITHYFDDSICGDEVTLGKPHPEVFLRACEKLDVLPENALVLEDSEAGIQAAYQGHVPVICVPDMKYPAPEYAAMTTEILPSLDHVLDYLKHK